MDINEIAEMDNIELEQEKLNEIGRLVVEGFDIDKASRSDWEKRNAEAMKLALQVVENKTYPWPNAANIKLPLVTISSIGFASRAMPALISSTQPVKCRTNGEDPDGAKAERAKRVSSHMSYQIMEEDEDWEAEMDKLLMTVPIVGTSFKKTYYDTLSGMNKSIHVLASDLVVGYFAKSLETTRRITHIIPLYKNDIKEREMSGLFNKIEYSAPIVYAPDEQTRARDLAQGVQVDNNDTDAPHIFLEQHRWLDLDEDGYEEPYIVTVHRDTSKVVRIISRFDKVERDDKGNLLRIEPKHYFTKFGFIPSPDGGFYDLGFGCLLGPINESSNTIINQLVDSGTMATLGGGFLGRGVRIKAGKNRFEPGEWKRVDNYGDDLRKGVFPLPVREPSQVLFSLLGLLIDYGQRLGSSTDMMVGVNPGQNQTATTSMNVVEQGMKVFNGIFKRLHRSLKCEFRKLYVLNRDNLTSKEYASYIDSGNQKIFDEDYLGDPKDITPASDPNVASEAQNIAKAEALRQGAAGYFGYNRHEIEKRYLEAIKIEGIEQVLPDPKGPNAIQPPSDPKFELENAKLQMDSKTKEMKMQLDSMNLDLKQSIAQRDEEVKLLETKINEFKAETDRMMTIAEIAEKDYNARLAAIEADRQMRQEKQEQ